MPIPSFRVVILSYMAAMQAWAACPRPVQVPVAATGFSVIVDAQQKVSGIYPDVLTEAGNRANCRFVFKAVPRARLEALFETGAADMLLPAPRTARRDQHGLFVPLIQARATVISVDPKHEAVHTPVSYTHLTLPTKA